MNKRSFLKKISIINGVMFFTGWDIVCERSKNISYKNFTWVKTPMFRCYKIEDGSNIVTKNFYVKSSVLFIDDEVEIDFTEEKTIKNEMTYYTNEKLLNSARELGYTHLYSFLSYTIANNDRRIYLVRGTKISGWSYDDENVKHTIDC